MRLVFVLPLLAIAALAGCAPTGAARTANSNEQASARTCFRTMNVRNFRAEDWQTLYVRTSSQDVFQIQSAGVCKDLESAIGIELRPLDGFSNLCTGDFATLNVGSPGRSTCRVQIAKRLSADELAALPSRVRP